MKSTAIEAILVVVALSALPCSAFARKAEFDTDAIQKFLHRNFDEQKIAGMVIGVVDEHGSQIFAAGKLGDGTEQEVNGDTIFEIGSITKTFTVLLLEDMVKRGEMKLSDPIAKHLPKSVPVPSHNGKEITLAHLAGQDSGLPFNGENLKPKDPENIFAEYSGQDMYEFLSGYSLAKEPGTEFRYSNLGMSLLGHAIERKSGLDFESQVVQRICVPLAMADTRIVVPPELKSRLAIGHDDHGKPQPGMAFQVVAPAGALRATARDLLKYVSANAGLTSNELTPLMQQMHIVRHREAVDPVLGVRGNTASPWYDQSVYQPDNMRLLGHGGGTNGFATFIGFDLEHRRGVVVLSNQIAYRSSAVGWRILQNAPIAETNALTVAPVLEVVGIGTAVALEKDTKRLIIQQIISGSPAADAGLTKGLFIHKIDSTQTDGLKLDACMALLRGKAGSAVRLEIVNPGSDETRAVVLIRRKFVVSS